MVAVNPLRRHADRIHRIVNSMSVSPMGREQNGPQKLGGLDSQEIKLLGEVNEDEVIEYCKKLVAIPSIFESEHRISEEIARDLKDFGLEPTSVPVENCGPSVVGISSASKPKSSQRSP